MTTELYQIITRAALEAFYARTYEDRCRYAIGNENFVTVEYIQQALNLCDQIDPIQSDEQLRLTQYLAKNLPDIERILEENAEKLMEVE